MCVCMSVCVNFNFTFSILSVQAVVGTRTGIQIGTLEYTVTKKPTSITVIAVVCGFVVFSLILVALIVLCVCYGYKKKTSREQAEIGELRELLESEQEINERDYEELEQQVENMVSQMTMVHSQMKGGWCESVMP